MECVYLAQSLAQTEFKGFVLLFCIQTFSRNHQFIYGSPLAIQGLYGGIRCVKCGLRGHLVVFVYAHHPEILAVNQYIFIQQGFSTGCEFLLSLFAHQQHFAAFGYIQVMNHATLDYFQRRHFRITGMNAFQFHSGQIFCAVRSSKARLADNGSHTLGFGWETQVYHPLIPMVQQNTASAFHTVKGKAGPPAPHMNGIK